MLKTINVREAVEKEVVGFGNGSIVYTPKKWIGQRVLVVLEEKPLDIKAEVMEILKPHFGAIEGIYLYGSFARGEQTEESDVDILVISGKKFGLKKIRGFEFLIKTKEEFVKELEKDSTLFLCQVVEEAMPIFNERLLGELRKVKVKPDFEYFFETTLGAFKNTKELLEADKKIGGKYLDSTACVYSLILRLRGLFLIQCFIKGQKFSNKGFKKFIKSHDFGEEIIENFLEIYRAERDERKPKSRILLADAERLFEVAKVEFMKTEKLVKG